MTATKRSHLIPEGQRVWTLEQFGVCDTKGRQVGSYYIIGECEFVEYNSELHGRYGSYVIEPGTYFFTNVQAARDGSSYGACNSSKYFKTMAEAQAEIGKYLADAKKRAIKNFGGQ